MSLRHRLKTWASPDFNGSGTVLSNWCLLVYFSFPDVHCRKSRGFKLHPPWILHNRFYVCPWGTDVSVAGDNNITITAAVHFKNSLPLNNHLKSNVPCIFIVILAARLYTRPIVMNLLIFVIDCCYFLIRINVCLWRYIGGWLSIKQDSGASPSLCRHVVYLVV